MSITDLELLSEGSRLERLRYRHRDFYLTLADEALEGVRGPDQAQWRRVLGNEYNNFVHAFQWSEENEDAESALRLSITIALALRYRGDLSSGEGFLRTALDLPAAPSKQRVKGLLALAENLSMPEPTAAMQVREQALEAARAVGDEEAVIDALTALGGWVSSASRQTQTERKTHLEEALARAQSIGYERGVAEVAWRLSPIYWSEHLWEEAKTLEQLALDYYRKVGDAENVGWMLYQEAWAEPDPSRSKRLGQEALHLAAQIDDLVLLGCCYEQLTWIDLEGCGNPGAARSWLNSWARDLSGRSDVARWHHDWQRMDLAYLDLIQGRWHDARGHLEHFFKSGQNRNHLSEQMQPFLYRAWVDLELDGYQTARDSLLSALEVARTKGSFLGRALIGAGEVALAGDDLVWARELAEEGLKEYPLSAWKPNVLMCLIELKEGNPERAMAHLDAMEKTAVAESYKGRVSEIQQDLLRSRVFKLQGKLQDAADLLTASIRYLHELNHLTDLSDALEQSADLHAFKGDDQTALILLGAAAELRRKIEYSMRERHRTDYEELLTRLRGGVSEQDFEGYMREGAKLSLSDAVEKATTFDKAS